MIQRGTAATSIGISIHKKYRAASSEDETVPPICSYMIEGDPEPTHTTEKSSNFEVKLQDNAGQINHPNCLQLQ